MLTSQSRPAKDVRFPNFALKAKCFTAWWLRLPPFSKAALRIHPLQTSRPQACGASRQDLLPRFGSAEFIQRTHEEDYRKHQFCLQFLLL